MNYFSPFVIFVVLTTQQKISSVAYATHTKDVTYYCITVYVINHYAFHNDQLCTHNVFIIIFTFGSKVCVFLFALSIASKNIYVINSNMLHLLMHIYISNIYMKSQNIWLTCLYTQNTKLFRNRYTNGCPISFVPFRKTLATATYRKMKVLFDAVK